MKVKVLTVSLRLGCPAAVGVQACGGHSNKSGQASSGRNRARVLVRWRLSHGWLDVHPGPEPEAGSDLVLAVDQGLELDQLVSQGQNWSSDPVMVVGLAVMCPKGPVKAMDQGLTLGQLIRH